ncbi:hypothetical protein E2C01_078551 [Portunus trituberculatus]|uniref:Uncharacterized protein n=1 Tax=Portunus trituberculatus TaxID=210409 RepID=A0A5B7IJ36_PORTR|nr:hypothetical protein [Portunus trituberculatus]
MVSLLPHTYDSYKYICLCTNLHICTWYSKYSQHHTPVPHSPSTHLDSLEVAGDLLSLGCLFSSFEASDPRRDQKPLTVGEAATPAAAPCPMLPLLLLLLRFMGRGERGVEGPAGCMGSLEGLGVTGPLPVSPAPPPSPSSRLRFGESLTEELEPRPESRHATLQKAQQQEEEEEEEEMI